MRLNFVVLGCGSRGRGFARWIADRPDVGEVVAVADPSPERRREVAAMFESVREFEDWQSAMAEPRLADVAIDATMDRDHVGSATAAMARGYHLLLEKPMAVTLEDCERIDRVRRETDRIVAVCHSLRYDTTYAKVRELIDAGEIGRVVSLDQLEAVEHIHQSHSFVRGNWGNESRSTFMLLSKSCHDVDVIASLLDVPCRRVASFGSLSYFRRENAPQGAPSHCVMGCPVERECPYHAEKIYLPETGWAGSTPLRSLDRAARHRELATSPFGRCVFQADNDVVDHQVLAMEFEGGVTATFTMTAFTPDLGRRLRVHGTRGYLEADISAKRISLWRFWAEGEKVVFELPPAQGSHGGADDRVMRQLVQAVRTDDASHISTGTDVSLATHRIVFAAERARREARVVEI